ncbi:MAG: hypothetical protein JO307_31425 [Bryobacterales bacterium]|nr:hypothetical protein [Bryobacterales bacterium]MBV9398767.1 hypothetical protein [Bryobacterales bacterium]
MEPRCREAVEKGRDHALEGTSVIVGLSSRMGVEALAAALKLAPSVAPHVRQRAAPEVFSVWQAGHCIAGVITYRL